ncbi:MAG TPA: NAD-dependent succinate-semialdehyde dehydrogenase [Candidatus Baltobacteraceae bacterium]|nr:NAD-dependent succinate-semialdehyde dehydrogenase [Candidatus Baltobacteraceae bacterium]
MTTVASEDAITTRDPANGKAIARHPLHTPEEIERRLALAQSAFAEWSTRALEPRLHLVHTLGAYFRTNKEALAHNITREMGKTIGEAEAEIEKCARACDYYADHAPMQLAPQNVETNAKRSYVAYRPLGPVLAVMPWNFPFFQVVRFAVPAIAAGNVAVLKHASNVTGCGATLENAFREAGFPSGVFTTLVIRASRVEDVIADSRIAAVTVTGSEPAGSAVAAAAGRHLKKSVLELGGSDAFIVLRDADVQAAAKTAVRARFQNCGQSCIAAKRFIVEAPAYEAFCDAFAKRVSEIRVGDPMDRATTMGPLARHDLVDELERQVEQSRASGARVLHGGARIPGPGAFYQPTLLADVTTSMPVFSEETFGPAAAILPARDADEAVALANASRFGLGNNVWSADVERAERIAGRLQSGLVFINDMTASDPRLPFGGVKKSGYGRELAQFGLREFTNVQTVWIG